jgi:hypothetical protein
MKYLRRPFKTTMTVLSALVLAVAVAQFIKIPTTHADSAYTFSGTFKDSSGNPLSGATIQLDNDDGNSSSATTASDGSFSIVVAPDKYALTIVDSGADGMSVDIHQPHATPSIDLTTSNITQNLVLPVATVTARFYNGGLPAANVPIDAFTSDLSSVALYSGDPGYGTAGQIANTGNADSSGQASFTSLVGAVYSGANFGEGICINYNNSYCNSSPYTVTSGTNALNVPADPFTFRVHSRTPAVIRSQVQPYNWTTMMAIAFQRLQLAMAASASQLLLTNII